jgi:hypothetical protein
MSNRNIESAAFQFSADDDHRGNMETLMADLEADAQWIAEMEARDAETLAAEQEYNALRVDADGTPVALPALQPITARCNAFPAQPLAEFAGVFDKPVRSVAARVRDAIEAM